MAGAVAAAVLAAVAGTVSGHWLYGVAIAAGLLIGSLNPLLAKRGFAAAAGFRTTSLMRMGALSAAALVVGLLLGPVTIPFVIGGVALAQLLLVAVAAREVTRA